MTTRPRRLADFVRSKLAWGRVYRAISYLKSALWTVPLIAIALELLLSPLIRAFDTWQRWYVAGLSPAGATALYQTVITMTLSFLVFTFGSLLVAIQVAGGQLTPRIIATTLLRNNVVRYSVGLFVFTLVFAVAALNRQEDSVHHLVSLVTGILGVACIADFLFLIDYAARLLRPVAVVARIGDEGVAMIRAVYPAPATALPPEAVALHEEGQLPRREVEHRNTSEIVLAVDISTLVALARSHDGVIEFVPQVGDFVAEGEPLFVLHGGATAIDDRALHSTVAFGPERTLEQDPMFAFRIIVDIGLKALSPAINDPTTAVLALDQVHRLLRMLGRRRLRGEVILDDGGQPRVIFRTPNWEDYVQVACSEIRACGANNLQIARRMRAMLENLRSTLPEHRRPTLEMQLDLLDWAVQKHFSRPEELALARIPDSQGLGGSSGSQYTGSG
ncbi:MAG TPA: DUF2254 domain-containing protein [Casimicrobiaceae bacterium]|nr:DUF2254 domain-containing protein [Casimicrobiaceae bacterium]